MQEHRIIITGSNGLLGQKLVHLLKGKTEVELLATSIKENRISDQVGYDYKSLDITDMEAVMEICGEFEPTAIINTAAMTQVDLCEELKEECRLANVGAVGYLIAAAKQHNAHLLQISTDFVFDGEDGPYSEEDIVNPLSYYGKSKSDAESLVQNSGLDKWSIARTIILYGVAEKMSRSNLILWAMDGLQKNEPMRVVKDQFRAPTLAEDLAQGCWEIIKRQKGGIYHLSGPKTQSIYEIVETIGKYFNWDTAQVESIFTSDLDQKAIRPPKTGFNLSKAQTELDYYPKSLEEGLELVANQLQSRAVS